MKLGSDLPGELHAVHLSPVSANSWARFSAGTPASISTCSKLTCSPAVGLPSAL